jgi:hypothetical protein
MPMNRDELFVEMERVEQEIANTKNNKTKRILKRYLGRLYYQYIRKGK